MAGWVCRCIFHPAHRGEQWTWPLIQGDYGRKLHLPILPIVVESEVYIS